MVGHQANQVIRVFICDDNALQLGMLSDALAECDDIEVVGTAMDGEAAVTQITQLRPDVVICDMVMPMLDGLGLLEQVRKLPTPPQVIILTALRGENFISQAQELGAAYYMVKPVNPAVLAQRVYTIMEQPVTAVAAAEPAPKPTVSQASRSLEEQIGAILLQVRIPAHLSGYRYLRTAVQLSLEDPDLLDNVTYALYPAVARQYGTSATSVERSIRHAISTAWNRGGPEDFSKLMGCHLESCDKPTNCELMSCLVETLRYQKERF